MEPENGYRSDQMTDFVLQETRPLPQFNATGKLYKHQKHGTQYLHLECDDPNNFFIIIFRTFAPDNKGITHVCEHLVLAGGKKYPVNDVFTEIMKRSLCTYINALTSLDYTMYPIGSMNETDFHNLIDVYLDSVFQPLLSEELFMSECHHLELEDMDDPNSPLIHGGIVYNEMLGVLSDAAEYFAEQQRAATLPDTIYKYIEGGHPDFVKELTREELLNLYHKYYTPSNCVMFHYGSFNTEKVMKHVDEFINQFEYKPSPGIDVPISQPLWNEPRTVEVKGPGKEIMTSLSWVIGDDTDVELIIAFMIIQKMLTSGASSPLYQKLIKAGIAKKWCGNSFYVESKPVIFKIGVRGIKEENIPLFVSIIEDTLQNVDFDPVTITAVINAIELSDKKVEKDYGVSICFTIVQQWMAGLNPLDMLNRGQMFANVREKIAQNPKYLEGLVKEKLVNNPSRVHLIMRPNPDFAKQLNNERKAELEQLKSQMTKEQLDQLVEKVNKMNEAIFGAKDNIEKLPKIHKSDIEPKEKKVEYKIDHNIYTFAKPLNGIVFVRIKAKLPMNHPLICDMPLLFKILPRIGAGDLDDAQFSKQVKLYTGGISQHTDVYGDQTDPEYVEIVGRLNSYCLKENFEHMIRLLRLIIFEPNLKNEKSIRACLGETESSFLSNIVDDGSYYARLLSQAGLNRVSALEEMTEGISSYRRLKEVLEIEDLSEHFMKLYTEIFRKAEFQISIHADGDIIDGLQKKLHPLIDELNSSQVTIDYSVVDQFMEKFADKTKMFIDIEGSSNFCAASMSVPNEESPQSGALRVAMSLVENDFLYQEIRQKLGAYGAGATYNGQKGTIEFSSYRDSNSVQVLDAINRGIGYLNAGNYTEDQVDNAILQVFQRIDSPSTPQTDGLEFFTQKQTYEQKQQRREKILAANKSQLQEATSKLDNSSWRYAIIGSASLTVPEGFTVEKL